jgi:hypothetical protein
MALKRLVVISGVSGLDLSKVLELARSLGAATAKYEDYVEDEFKAPIYHVSELLLVRYGTVVEKFNKAFEKMIKDLEASGSDSAVIAAHMAYYRRNNVVASPIVAHLAQLASKGVEVSIIDYVDDYYHILYRVAKRVASGETPGVAGFQVLDPLGVLNWRSIHHSIVQTLVLFGASLYVYASKHSRTSHERLLSMLLGLEPPSGGKYISAYISHPITIVRKKALEQGEPLDSFKDALEIEEFKEKLEESCEHLVIFSPTTIDELITKPNSDELETRIERSNRWPHTENGLHEYPYPVDLRDEFFDKYLYPVQRTTMNPGYLMQLKASIEASIERRDLGYVSQADLVIAYRPTMYLATHMGVETEIKTAIAIGKPVYSVMPPDERNIAYRLFRFEYPLYSTEELLNLLKCTKGK